MVCSLPRVDFAGGRKEQEGGRKEGSSALPAGGGSTGSAPKGQQEIQVSKLVNSGWKSMLEGAVLGSQAPGGEGKCRISVLQGECVGPQPCNNRPLLKEARSAGQQQRRTSSRIPPPMVLHFPRIPLLLESTSSCLGRYFSSDSSHIAELPVTIYHSYRGLHQCNRIENTTLGLQQLHNNAPSPISTTAKCTVRGINSHIWSNPS